MPTDVMALLSRVVDRAVEKSGYVAPAAGLDSGPGAEVLIDTLATHLLAFLGIGGAGNGAGQPSTSDLERICADQMARNIALAGALGACECWGELAACPACRGHGGPGWRRPDRASFDVFVRPVLHKMKAHRMRVHRAPVAAL